VDGATLETGVVALHPTVLTEVTVLVLIDTAVIVLVTVKSRAADIFAKTDNTATHFIMFDDIISRRSLDVLS